MSTKVTGNGWVPVDKLIFTCPEHGRIGVNEQLKIKVKKSSWVFCKACVLDVLIKHVVPLQSTQED